jgi:hypothetical protein
MSDDFDNGLRDLAAHAARAHAGGAGLPTAFMVRRARRRRRARDVILTAVSVAGIAALVAGGATLLGQRHVPTPPAVSPSPTQSSSPTSSPTADPVALPVGDPSLPFGACGSMVGSKPSDPTSPTMAVGATITSPTVTAGSPLGVRSSVSWPVNDTNAVLTESGGPRFLVVKDGVVVGIDDVYHGAATGLEAVVSSNGLLPVFEGSVDLTVCNPTDGSTDRALPAGAYTVYPTALVTEVPSDALFRSVNDGATTFEALAARPTAKHRTVIGEPIAFAITGVAEKTQRPAEPATGPDPFASPPQQIDLSCGAPAPAPTDLNGFFALGVDGADRTVALGKPLNLKADVTYTGAGRLRTGVFAHLDLIVTRDGTIVGDLEFQGDQYYSVWDMAHGTSVDVSNEPVPLGCSLDPTVLGSPLKPGVYQAYPRLDLNLLRLTLPGARPTSAVQDLGVSVINAPFTLTIT